jgi:NTE family protein
MKSDEKINFFPGYLATSANVLRASERISTMNAKQFTDDPDVANILKSLEKDGIRKKEFSDIIDGEGHQYVDLVMEGGGVLGIALVGFTYVLEKMGIRFAMLLSAMGKVNEEKTTGTIGILANMDLAGFVDGDDDTRDFIKAVREEAGTVKLIWKGAQVVDNVLEKFGLNPGAAFHAWMKAELEKMGIKTLADLRNQWTLTPGKGPLLQRAGGPVSDKDGQGGLSLVTAEITTESKVLFPAMARLFWSNPESVNPADFVRASMSIPLFFEPFRVKDLPQTHTTRQDWTDDTGYKGEPPRHAVFLDGGIMSNFPIDVFHEPDHVPLAPTFGVKLGVDRESPREVKRPGEFFLALVDTARHTHDFDFIKKNPDFCRLVSYIPTNEKNWLNFNLKPGEKVELFRSGALEAAKFLANFNWEEYKAIREKLLAVKKQQFAGPKAAEE